VAAVAAVKVLREELEDQAAAEVEHQIILRVVKEQMDWAAAVEPAAALLEHHLAGPVVLVL
jgi:hypothetical protein